MLVRILLESGYDLALRGMSYSHRERSDDIVDWWTKQQDKAIARAPKLAPMDKGHNKFLESIVVWIDIEASRAFHSEFDTYRVGMTKQSESTMHRLSKRPPMSSDFEPGTPQEVIKAFQDVWEFYKNDINVLKLALPEGFLQRRLVCTNYKCLKNIIEQRRGHRFRYWDMFVDAIMSQVEHPELLVS